MTATKKKIEEIISAYKSGPFYVQSGDGWMHEFEAFKQSRAPRWNVQADKFASLKHKKTDILERGLTVMPTTLFTIFKRQLSLEEWKWFDSVGGKKWFAKKFKEFRFSDTV